MIEKILEKLPDSVLNYLVQLANNTALALPAKKILVFESSTEFTCNTYPIYKYLSECKRLKGYKFVWLVEDKTKYKQTRKNKYVNYIKSAKTIKDKFEYRYYMRSAKCLIYSNRLLGVFRPDQFSFCLTHGMPIKCSKGVYTIDDKCTACLCISEFFRDSLSEDFNISPDKLVYLGSPRNDLLYSPRDVLKELNYDKFNKVIIWMPTYRQHKALADREKLNLKSTATGIPTINTEDEIIKVNEFCKENNILLILKPHPVQSDAFTLKSELTNFKIISNDFLAENDIQLYELIGKTDALITDYSSVYFDYILCDKPIGLTVDDIDEYSSKRGFAFENIRDVLKGEYIKSTDELISFLNDVAVNNDKHREERTVLKNKAHTIQDGTSTEKVCDYILKNLK